jgi:hypothetical protein
MSLYLAESKWNWTSVKQRSGIDAAVKWAREALPQANCYIKDAKVQKGIFFLYSQGKPLPFATVTLSSGGERFNRTGTAMVSGSTDSSGLFEPIGHAITARQLILAVCE